MWIRRTTTIPRRDSEDICCVERSWFVETHSASKGEAGEEEAEIEVVKQTCKSAVNPELEEWAKMMEALKHKASVPAEAMLLAASEETKNSVLLSEQSGKDVPCDKCRLPNRMLYPT